jgi:hypothetical protein
MISIRIISSEISNLLINLQLLLADFAIVAGIMAALIASFWHDCSDAFALAARDYDRPIDRFRVEHLQPSDCVVVMRSERRRCDRSASFNTLRSRFRRSWEPRIGSNLRVQQGSDVINILVVLSSKAEAVGVKRCRDLGTWDKIARNRWHCEDPRANDCEFIDVNELVEGSEKY